MPSSHAIRRQVIEVTVADQTTARWIAPLVSRLVRERMTPLLERLFDAASSGGAVVRIDRLELDLGRLDPDQFAEQLLARLATALPVALRQALAPRVAARGTDAGGAAEAGAVRPDQVADPLLLIGQFARTGGLPWWSDTRRRRVLDEAVVTALGASPAALVRTVRGLAGDDAALGRLIIHLSDESLASLFRAALPPADAVPRALMPMLERTPALAGLTRARLRLLAWRALIRAALGGARLALIETALTELAAAAGTTLALLAGDLRALIDGVGEAPLAREEAPLAPEEEPLAREIVEVAALYPAPAAPAEGDTAIAAALARLATRPELAALLARLHPLAARLTRAAAADCAAALQALADDTSATAAPSRIAALLRPFAHEGPIQLLELRAELALVAAAEADAAVPAQAPPAPAEDEDSRHTDLEALFARLAMRPALAALLARLRPLAARLTRAGTADCAAAVRALADDTSATAAPSRIAALLRPFAREGLIRPAELRDELAPVASAEADAAVPAQAPPAPAEDVDGDTDLAAALARLATRPELAALLARLRPLAARLSRSAAADWAAALRALAGDPSSAAVTSRIAALLRPFAREGLIQPAELRDELAAVAAAEADAAVPAQAPPAPAEGEDSRLVETAGLCLVWPFLPRFFARLGLLDEREAAFAGPAAAHRAALLLHHLATGETEALDYALVLPKVLCGLAPHAVHQAAAPIDAREADEAGQLLDAVIAHAACLGEITRDGLRGSFLIRPGILATRDGAWLLRVERRTEDVVLDRLPWTVQWARLPWMPAPMRVEW